MGWMELLSSLVSSVAWPVAVVVAVVVLRRSLAGFLARVTRGKVGPAGMEFELTAAAVESMQDSLALAAKTNIDPAAVTENVVERVTEAGGSPPLATSLMEERLQSEIAQDEVRRREELEDLVNRALNAGFEIGRAGSPRPAIYVDWRADGPHIHTKNGYPLITSKPIARSRRKRRESTDQTQTRPL